MTPTTTDRVDLPTCNVVEINPHVPNGRTILLTHGAWHSVRHYQKTFDDRPGWAYDFAAAGYRVLLVDYPGTGDSPEVDDPTVITNEYILEGFGRVIDSVDGPVDLLVHSMSGPIGVALLARHRGKIAHLVGVAPAQPVDLSDPPEVFEDLGDSVRVVFGNEERVLPKHGWTEGTPAFVTRCIGPGWRFPPIDHEVYLASLSRLWAGLSIERARDALMGKTSVGDLSGSSVLVISGTHDPNHPQKFDQRLVDWLDAHGSKVDFISLGDIGIEGNGHMMMLEDNSAEIAGVIIDWLGR